MIFRPLSTIFSEIFVVLICFGVPWLIALAAVGDPWRAVVVLAGIPSIGVLVWRAFRVSVVIDDKGITVNNYWRTRQLEWGDIAEVGGALETVGVAPTPVIAFRRDHDRALIKAVASAGRDSKKRALVLELKRRPELRNVPFELPPHLLREP